jgi:hypothetical protein
LGRVDNDGDYCPENCRWETQIENSNNKRTTVWICMDGRTHTIAEWSRELDVKPSTISKRKNKGWNDTNSLRGLTGNKQ